MNEYLKTYMQAYNLLNELYPKDTQWACDISHMNNGNISWTKLTVNFDWSGKHTMISDEDPQIFMEKLTKYISTRRKEKAA